MEVFWPARGRFGGVDEDAMVGFSFLLDFGYGIFSGAVVFCFLLAGAS